MNEKHDFFRPVLKCSGKMDTWYGKMDTMKDKPIKTLEIEEVYSILTYPIAFHIMVRTYTDSRPIASTVHSVMN